MTTRAEFEEKCQALVTVIENAVEMAADALQRPLTPDEVRMVAICIVRGHASRDDLDPRTSGRVQ